MWPETLPPWSGRMEINSISTQKNLDLELTLFLDSDDKNELNDKKSK